jgi:NitT/TauT family transport system substrate-binding protein
MHVVHARVTRRLLALLLVLAALVPATWTAARPAPAVALAAAPVDAPAAQTPTRVRLSGQRLAVEVLVWLGEERGYFRQEGIDIDHLTCGSASEMLPALATGQLDAAPMPANPAMWNAVARGVNARVVVDLGTYRPGESEQALMVRRQVVDAGRWHGLEDLRGLSIAITPPGKATTTACALSVGLQSAGLTLDDLDIQPITFPDMVGALANGSVDTAMMVEPFLSRAVQQGSAVRAVGVGDMYPGFTIATLGFADSLYTNRPVARGFVRAYLRALRDYLPGIAGQSGDAVRSEIVDVIARGTGIDPATVATMTPPYFNPNGLPNRTSMLYCYEFFRGQGLIPQPIPDAMLQNTLWGTDLVEDVLNEVGRLPDS